MFSSSITYMHHIFIIREEPQFEDFVRPGTCLPREKDTFASFSVYQSGVSVGYSLFFLTAAGRLKLFSRHSACLKAKKSRNVNENAKDMNRREQIIEQIYIMECFIKRNGMLSTS